MYIETGQVWASNLPGKPLLTVVTTSSVHFLFPIHLRDDKNNSYYATNDGFLKQIISPTGYSYKLTILVSNVVNALQPGSVPKKVRDAAEARSRKTHNERVLREYKLKEKGKQ